MSAKIKALFLCPSLSQKMGGIYEITRSLAQELQRNGINVEAIGLIDEKWDLDRGGWGSVPTHLFERVGPKSFGFSPELNQAVIKSDADLLHLHALWMYPSMIALNWKQLTKHPYVVTPNGMLEPWALRNSAWKKRIAGFLYERNMLRGAACLQANTEKELQDFRNYGLKNPIAIIPNGIDLPEEEGEKSKSENLKSKSGCKTLLFLGRIHPKKGLVNALRAFAKALDSRPSTFGSASWQFIIAGWDQGGHEAELKQLCEELGISVESRGSRVGGQRIEADVLFYGPAFGDEKKMLFQSADAFILPSLSEGQPMAVLEAWSYAIPVVMTPECNFCDGFEVGAAIRIETETSSMVQGMRELFSMSNHELRMMGSKGKELVIERYTWPKIALQMKEVYQWILGEGAAPDCVIGAEKQK